MPFPLRESGYIIGFAGDCMPYAVTILQVYNPLHSIAIHSFLLFAGRQPWPS